MLELVICMGVHCLTFKMPLTPTECIWQGQQYIVQVLKEHPGYEVKRYTCSANDRVPL